MSIDAQMAASAVRESVIQSLREINTRKRKHAPVPEDSRTAVGSHFNIRVPLRNGKQLVFNSLNGSLARWDREDVKIYDKLADCQTRMDTEELRPFHRGGFIVPEGTDELDIVEKQYNAVRFDPASAVITIAPTLACNFGCDYCFQGLDKPGGGMSQEVQDAFINWLKSKADGFNKLHIAWYGGEPLIGRETILELSDKILPVCREYGVNYSAFMVTNGFSLTADVAKALYDRGVTSYQVTLDGPEDYHDTRRHLLSGRPTYAKIVENLRAVMDAVPVIMSIRVNIDSRNSDRIKELIDDLEANGLAGRNNFAVYFAPVEAITEGCHGCNEVTMQKMGYGELEADLYRYAFEKRLTGLPKAPQFHGNCQAIRPNGLLLSPNGDLHKCWDTVSDPTMKVGTIFEVDKVEDDPLYQRWLDWTPFANDVCRNCKILPNCAGSCAYKFIHSDKTMGEAGALPCPSWKFNINERLFLRAEKTGVVQSDDWDPEKSATSSDIVGINHTYETVRQGSDASAERRWQYPLPVLG